MKNNKENNMAGKVKSAKDYPTVVKIAEIEKGKYMLNGVLNKEQLHALYSILVSGRGPAGDWPT